MALESRLQSKIKADLKKKGWRVIKAIMLSESGHPDLWCAKNGSLVLLEIKAPKGVHSPLQKLRQKEWRNDGFVCEVIFDFNDYLKLNL